MRACTHSYPNLPLAPTGAQPSDPYIGSRFHARHEVVAPPPYKNPRFAPGAYIQISNFTLNVIINRTTIINNMTQIFGGINKFQ